MSDPSNDVITIRQACVELRDIIAYPYLTHERAKRVAELIEQLRTATDNINRWLDENTVLQ